MQSGWNLEAVSIRYAAVGFGSHHWLVCDGNDSEFFVTVDDLDMPGWNHNKDQAFRGFKAAFGTARKLAESGADFVVAPIPDHNGDVLRRIASSYSMAIFPLVRGVTRGGGQWESHDDRGFVLQMLGRLHQMSGVVSGLVEIENFVVPGRQTLEAALDDLANEWNTGPFAEPARRLLMDVRLDVLNPLRFYDRLVAEVCRDRAPWVVTHGEPHASYVIWTTAGPKLIDWDTLRIAPAARDLWMLEDPTETSTLTRGPGLTLYRLWWDCPRSAST